MTQVQKDIDLEVFLDSVFVMSSSHSTKASYRGGINKFQKFLEEKYNLTEADLVHKVKNGDVDVYRVLSEFVVNLSKSGYSPKSLRVWLPAVKGYLRYVGLEIYSEKFKSLVRMPRVITTREEGLTKEMIVRLLRNSPPKLQTAILVAVSSGMRLGELVQFRISDVDFESNPTRIRIRAHTSKGRQAREAFLTTEATKALKDYLERFFGWKEGQTNGHLKDTTIFGRTSVVCTVPRKSEEQLRVTSAAIAENVLQKTLEHTLEKIPDLNVKGENGRKIIHFHAFRKYFRTVVGNEVGRDFAEALMGHRFYLDTYYNLPADERRKLYLKAESRLTISDFTMVEKNLTEISERQKILEEKLARIELYAQEKGIPVPSWIPLSKS